MKQHTGFLTGLMGTTVVLLTYAAVIVLAVLVAVVLYGL